MDFSVFHESSLLKTIAVVSMLNRDFTRSLTSAVLSLALQMMQPCVLKRVCTTVTLLPKGLRSLGIPYRYHRRKRRRHEKVEKLSDGLANKVAKTCVHTDQLESCKTRGIIKV